MEPFTPKLEESQTVTTQMGMPDQPAPEADQENYKQALDPGSSNKSLHPEWENQNLKNVPGLNERWAALQASTFAIEDQTRLFKWAFLLGSIFLAYKYFRKGK